MTPLDCSTQRFPALYHLLESVQPRACWVSDAIQSSHAESVTPSNHLTLSQWCHPIISCWVSDAIQSSHAESVVPSNHLTLSQWCHPIISRWVSGAIQSSHAESVTPSNHPILRRLCGNVPFLIPGIRHVCLFSFFPSSFGKILLIFSRNHCWLHLNYLIGVDRQIFPRDLNSKKRSDILISSWPFPGFLHPCVNASSLLASSSTL